MKIFNQSKNIILAEEVSVADTLFKRARGLLGKKEFRKGQAMILAPANSIHTFFMRFPIDLLFIDKENKVIKAISSLGPWRISAIYFRSRLVIELPAGVIQSTSTQVGDTLLLQEPSL